MTWDSDYFSAQIPGIHFLIWVCILNTKSSADCLLCVDRLGPGFVQRTWSRRPRCRNIKSFYSETLWGEKFWLVREIENNLTL